MTYQTIQDVNITGLDGILTYVSNEVPIFIPFLLIMIWLMVSAIIYFSSKKFGQGDIFATFAASGFFVATLGTLLTFAVGIINVWILSATFLIVLVSVVLLMIRRSRD